jgi:hypothetical protein
MSFAPLIVLAAGSPSSEHGINPYFVGGALLIVFLLLMAGLLAFGAGRDHT